MIHKDLEVWKKAIELVTGIYKITAGFPKNEIYGLIIQIRRSAVSVPSNIAEGAARKHRTEYIQFLYIAMGSLAELETQMIIAGNLKFCNEDTVKEVNSKLIVIRSQLSGLIRSLQQAE